MTVFVRGGGDLGHRPKVVYPNQFVYTTILGVYPNFVYHPTFQGINEPVRITSDLNELAATIDKG